MNIKKQFKKTAFAIIGGIALFFGGIILPMSIFSEMVEGASRWPGIIFGLVCMLVSIFCFTTLFVSSRREKKFNRYAAFIGNQKSIPIKWLAEKMNCGAGNEVMTGYYSKCAYCDFVLDSGEPK